MIETNRFGQPVGARLAERRVPIEPQRTVLEGAGCRLEPLDAEKHADPLWNAYSEAGDPRDWTYLTWGPFADRAALRAWARERENDSGAVFHAVVVDGFACGVGAYLSVAPEHATVELGHLHFAPRLRRTSAATEALHLWIDHAFALGYRRIEWKCDVLNAPSRSAARRLGFSFEGIFRNHRSVRGRSRDTAWYAIVEQDWPALRAIHREWLAAHGNEPGAGPAFRLSERTAPLRRPDPKDFPPHTPI
ncbi:MAG: GNAT family N-acetyltransferase [Armatimonadota bacterium]